MVVEIVAGAGQVGGTREFEVFQVGAEGVGDGCADRVNAGTSGFAQGIGRLSNYIGIITASAGHAVIAGTAIEHIVAVSA
ncbi:hypothetical protein D3C76_1079250 [compost metagenome]